MQNTGVLAGFGNPNASIAVYIENPPPLAEYQHLAFCRPMKEHEIYSIAQQTGNHWRKIFNVYAKLVFELTPLHYDSWQALRDHHLLQAHSDEKLLFSPPTFITSSSKKPSEISIVMGKTYATKLNLAQSSHWLTPSFAMNSKQGLIICPYFDYRQLSNIKITQLCTLIKQLKSSS